jgi:3-oxoadipate enol-lactonase
VGMSQGARVVLQFAAAFPRMVSCIILDGPPELGSQNTAGRSPDLPYQHYCELAQGQGLSAFRDEWRQHPLAQLRTQDPQAHALLARMIARYPGRDLTDTGGHGAVASPAERFESVDRPVLVINGELDLESRRQIGKQLVSRYAQAEWAAIPDAGHLCSLDNPSAYNNVLRRFLARHAIPATTH